MALSISITYVLTQIIAVDPLHTQLQFTLSNDLTGLSESDTVIILSTALDSGVIDSMTSIQRVTQVQNNFQAMIQGNIAAFASKCRVQLANSDASADLINIPETVVATSYQSIGSLLGLHKTIEIFIP